MSARHRPNRTPIALVALLTLGAIVALPAGAQLRAGGQGITDAGLLLRQLDGEKRVLMIAAHPDDEDTALLTTLARGMGARTAYLSLSRGEGGQNLIGPEMAEGMGLIRTGELLSARGLDGAEQFFTRAFDFGFSKSAEETLSRWPEEALLEDVVRVIRTFRPQVVVSVFSGTPQDGHGHHQVAGMMAHRAFEAAADSARFPGLQEEGLESWAPDKLYRVAWRNPEGATLAIETGTLDPLLGRSWFQVAMASRSRHRSQDMGVPETPGPRRTLLTLWESRVGALDAAHREDGLFHGIDTTLVGLARRAVEEPTRGGYSSGDRLEERLEAYRSALAEAGELLHPTDPGRALPALLEALEALDDAEGLNPAIPMPCGPVYRIGPEARHLGEAIRHRKERLQEAILALSGVVVEARVDRAHLAAGEFAEVEVVVWNGGAQPVEVGYLSPGLPQGWRVTDDSPRLSTRVTLEGGAPAFLSGAAGAGEGATVSAWEPTVVPPGELRSWRFRFELPRDATPTRLPFLEAPRDGSMYRWPADFELRGIPLGAPLVSPSIEVAVGESPLLFLSREAVHVYADKAYGELRVPVQVVPALSVRVEPSLVAWPEGRTEPLQVALRITNLSRTPFRGNASLLPPAAGWRVNWVDPGFVIGAGETTVTFQIAPFGSPPAGRSVFLGEARSAGTVFTEEVEVIDYPHIDPLALYHPAELTISSFPVEVRPGLRVGYVEGPGDDGIRALRDLGVEVYPLEENELRFGDLTHFHTIVLGARAYEIRTDLMATNARLLEFARRGGTVVVQYNKYEFPEGDFAPFPLTMARPHDRVTDPDAPVTFLAPGHPIFSEPNRLGPSDFEGWVQERGLYFLRTWDERYTPLLEMADPGEEPNRGSLVVAKVGEGAYVYTGLALFRQLPAGVPGAYRLLANLVSLRGSDL